LEFEKKTITLTDNREDYTALTYEQLVIRGCEEIAHTLKSIAIANNFFILSLSGGRDSRALLAASRYVFGTDFDDICYVRTGTSPEQRSDFEVVMKLGKLLNINVNRDIPIKRRWSALSSVDALTRWRLGNSSLYYNWGPNPSVFQDTKLISIRGGQGNAAGDYGNLDDLSGRISKAVNIDQQFIIDHFRLSAGAQIYDSGSEVFDKHYMQWRYRIHYGRKSSEIYNWAINIDPLINSKVDAANFRIPQDKRYDGILARDLIAAFDAKCLEVEFSSKGGQFNADWNARSPFFPFGIGNFSRSQLNSAFIHTYRDVSQTGLKSIPEDFDTECVTRMKDLLLKTHFFEYFDDISKGSNIFDKIKFYPRETNAGRLYKNQFAKAFLFATLLD
jgi:hypothetical protein